MSSATDEQDASDAHDRTSRPRKRIRQACLNCRKKKVRCSGEKPECSFCLRLAQNCQYAPEFAEGNAENHPPYFCLSENTIDSLAVQQEELSVSLSALLRRIDVLENTLKVQAANNVASSSSTQKQPSPQHVCAPNTELSYTEKLPPTYTQLFTADVYFRFCHNQPYSLFHEGLLKRRIEAQQVPEHLIWAFLGTAARYCSIPGEHNDRQGEVMSYAKRAWNTVMLPWDGKVDDQEAVDIIRTLLLVASIELTAGEGESAYMKLGMALRLALHAKLHLEPPSTQNPVQKEERRRVFWALYLQDKLISLSREKFPLLPDNECRLRLPCSEIAFSEGRDEDSLTLETFSRSHWDQTAADSCSPLAVGVLMISALNRVSQYVLHDERYAEHDAPWLSGSLHSILASHLLQIELHFGMSEPLNERLERMCSTTNALDQHVAGPLIYSQALFHLSYCLLHHPFLLQQRLQKIQQRIPNTFLSNTWETCRTHAKALNLFHELRDDNKLVMTALYGYCAMIAGTIHTLSLHDRDVEIREEADKLLQETFSFLSELSRYWKHAGLMTRRLHRFRDQNLRDMHFSDWRAGVDGQTLSDSKSFWQSVDYTLLSTATPPRSPVSVRSPERSVLPLVIQDTFDFSVFSVDDVDTSNWCNFSSLDRPPDEPML